jgi:filamentous hemagglutinin family protein
MKAIYFVRIKRIYRLLGTLTGILNLGIFLPAIAQVTSDGTTNTIVNLNGSHFTILNGVEKGNNLFHSFSNFSVPTKGSATFDLVNTPNITTIFSRITGGSVSNIDGLIQTVNSNNPVSLFLMNPAGIMFGANASLNIGGSFVGTTANSIKFADGAEFSATNSSAQPLLTMSVPLGLQFEGSSGTRDTAPIITVQGQGSVVTPRFFLPTNVARQSSTALEVKSGKTLALIGGDISITGGIISAREGNIELGSVGSGVVNINPNTLGWTFNYDEATNFRDIHLAQQALLDASGLGGGSIQVQGAKVSLADGSNILIQNQGDKLGNGGNISPGNIYISASEALELRSNAFKSSIFSEVLQAARGNNINISTKQLTLNGNTFIGTKTFGNGNSGTVTVNASESIKLSKSSLEFVSDPLTTSAIGSTTYGLGEAGKVVIHTGNLSVKDGGNIASTTLSPGHGGEVAVTATDSVEVVGVIPKLLQASVISASTLNTGNAGNLTLNTTKLIVRDGGRVDSSTFAAGTAGSVTINAKESVEISGTVAGSINPSLIISSANIPDEPFKQFLRLLSVPTGDSGDVTINTGRLMIVKGGLVNARNDGRGDAGAVRVNANSIFLDSQGGITAATEMGRGGNIILNTEILQLRHNSNITGTAGGSGDGGNITLNAGLILGLENSDIIANAFHGKGGNINIKTQGIFGLALSNTLTPTDNLNNDITASSQFNINGTVQINNIGVEINSGLVELPTNVIDSSQQITSGCSGNPSGQFIATGRGGIPDNPTQLLTSDRTWVEMLKFSIEGKTSNITSHINQAQISPKSNSPKMLIEATGWHRNQEGKIELVADKSSTDIQQVLECAAIPKS